MRRMPFPAVLPALLVFLPASEAVGDVERLAPGGPSVLRNILLAVVLLLGIAIIMIRAGFNRKITRKSPAGLDVSGVKAGSPRTSPAVKLKHAKIVDIHENREYGIPADGALTIGRGMENMVSIKNPSVSRSHAKIVPEPEGYVIYDLGSKKGTFVNGEMVSRRVLKNSDIIEIAREDFMFYYG